LKDFYIIIIIINDFTNTCLYNYAYACVQSHAEKETVDCELREKTNKMQQLDVYYQYFLTCFGHHYAHLQENKTCVTARGVLCWFCWMWLVAVVGRCVIGCEHCESRTVTFTVLTPYNAAPHNRYQPHPAEPAQHTMCGNTCLVLLKMGIMMPKTC